MKRILFVHHVAAIGGGSYCLLNILKTVDRSQIIPIALIGEEGPLVDEIKKLGIEVFVLKGITSVPYNKSLFRRNSIHKFILIHQTIDKFDEFLKAHSVDVVYFNNVMLYPFLKIAKNNSLKTVIHIREHWPENQHKQQLKCLREYVRDYADFVVAINSYSANLVPNLKNPPIVIYDWIDFSDRYEEISFDQVLGEDCSDKKVFLFTGGFADIKGILEVVESFSQIVSDKNARLLILGNKNTESPIGLIGKIKRLLERLGYKPYQTRVLELVNKDSRIICVSPTYKIRNIYEKAYCMLSFFRIPHANLALAECIILETPCIAAQTEESVEYSDNGSLACLVPFDDKKEFSKALSNIDSIRNNLKIELNKGAKKVAVLFDKERNVTNMNNFLNSL